MGMRCVALAGLAVLSLPQAGLAQDGGPTVRAKMLSFDAASGSYTPLAEARAVRINITKDGERFEAKTHYADENGVVKFEGPVGEPFSVVFYGAGRTPEIKELAGWRNAGNVIYVCLLTKEQYLAGRRSIARGARLEAIRRELAAIQEYGSPSVKAELDGLLAELDGLLGALNNGE